MTSEHEMYKNDPAAKHEKTISDNSEESRKAQPMITPSGVNSAKIKSKVVMNRS